MVPPPIMVAPKLGAGARSASSGGAPAPFPPPLALPCPLPLWAGLASVPAADSSKLKLLKALDGMNRSPAPLRS